MGDCRKVFELNPSFPEPATANGTYRIKGSAIAVQNAGDDTATINGVWRLAAGESMEIDADQPYDVINFTINIRFAGVGVDPYVQFAEVQPNIRGYSAFNE